MITTAEIGRAVGAQVGRLPLCLCVFLVMQLWSTCQPQEASAAAPCCYLAATPDPWAGLSNPIQSTELYLVRENRTLHGVVPRSTKGFAGAGVLAGWLAVCLAGCLAGWPGPWLDAISL